MSKSTNLEKSVDFTRLLVIGCSGSGKTTLSKRLSVALGKELVHLDKILWKPFWTMTTADEKREIMTEVLSKDEWLIDGLWLSTLQMRLERATAVIFLDYNRWVCFFGAYKRYRKQRNLQADDHAENCFDNFNKEFRKYILTYNKLYRKDIYEMLEKFGMEKVLVFKTRRETAEFLKKIEEKALTVKRKTELRE